MRKYHQITLEEREKIHLLYKEGVSFRKIGQKLGRSPATICREVNRNKCATIGYAPDRADKFAKQRAFKNPLKIDKYPKLKSYVIERLQQDKWPPEAITAVLKSAMDLPTISHETIYKFIYSIEGQKLHLYTSLMYRRPKRQAKFSRVKRYSVPEDKRIENRLENINNRSEIGHAEGDLTFFAGSNSQNVITTIERASRMIKLAKNDNKTSLSTVLKLKKIAENMKYKSLTLDNGSEFAQYGVIELSGTKVYFCKPHSPWQKGSIERMHASLHKYIPKKTNINEITDDKLKWAEEKMNNLPRKCLGYLTPKQYYDKHLNNHTVALAA